MSDSKHGLLGLGSHGSAVADVRARLAALSAQSHPERAGLEQAGAEELGPEGGPEGDGGPPRRDAALHHASPKWRTFAPTATSPSARAPRTYHRWTGRPAVRYLR